MSDPVYDDITFATLSSLRHDVVFDSFLPVRYWWLCSDSPKWTKIASKRMHDMGIQVERIKEILVRMAIENKLDMPKFSEKDTWSGGSSINEPFIYGGQK